MQKLRLYSRLFLLVILCAPVSFSQNILDLTFNAAPSIKPMSSNKGQIVQPDGKVIIWGGNLNPGSMIKGQVARLNADGTVDTTFSYCSCHIPNVASVLLQADGKLILTDAAGNFAPAVSKTAIRLNPDGSVDIGFNRPVFAATVVGVKIQAVQPDGKLLFEENFFSSTERGRRISRYNSDGTIDNTFTKILFDNGTNSSSFGDIKIAPDGKIYFGFNMGTSVGLLRRYNSDGTIDNTWAEAGYVGTNARVSRLDLQPDGKVLVAGLFNSVNGHATANFVRLLSAGAVDTTFAASGFFNSINNVRYLSSGKIMVSGSRTSSSTLAKIFRLNADGSLDASLADGLFAERPADLVKTMVSAESSKGEESSLFVSDTTVSNYFVLDSLERPVFFGTPAGGSAQFYRLDTSGNVDAGFTARAANFATVHQLALQSDGKIIVTGGYDLVGGIARSGISRVNADGSVDTSFDPGTGIPWTTTSPGRVLVQPDGKMLVNEAYTYNGASMGSLIRVNTDGTRDTSFAQGFSSIKTLALQSDGKIVVGGNFTTLHGSPRNQIGRINSDGSLDAAFSPVLGQPTSGQTSVNALAVQSDGKIIIVGTFAGVNGFLRVNVARLNADGTLDQTFNAPDVLSATENLLAIQPDGKSLIYYGAPARLERRNSDGSIDPSFKFTGGSGVRTMAVRANGDIFLGGKFDQMGGVRRKNFAWLSSTGRVENGSFLLGSDEEVSSVVLQPDNKVLIGGLFTKFEGVARPGIARVTAETFTTRTKFDFDGDGRSDISVFRPSDGNWYLARSTAGFAVNHFGQDGDQVVPSDYDGDGKTDLAIYRDGAWWYLGSSNSTVGLQFYGAAGDVPLRADLDGDNKDDFIVYRPSTVQWFLNFSSYPNEGYPQSITYQWGSGGDIPFLQDFDGDGRSWMGFYRPSEGKFYYTSDGTSPTSFATFQWGMNGDVPVLGDYDGDGRTDFAVWRPSNGAWYICYARDAGIAIFTWGLAGDKPVVGDYDGDGKSDIAIWRPSSGVWYIMGSTAGFMGMQYGLSTDKAIPNAYLP